MNEQAPIFTAEDEKINGDTANLVVKELISTAETRGLSAAIAQATGMMFGATHFLKSIGLRRYFKAMQENLQSYMRRPSSKLGGD